MMLSIPAIGFSAYSGVGKTTLIEQLLRLYTARGLRVAVLKHDAHDFIIDQEGKDSRRFTKAGAVMTILSSDTQIAVIESRPSSFPDLLNRIHDADLILVEGYKDQGIPRIGVYRAASGKALPETPEHYAAIVTDTVFSNTDVPQFHFEEIPSLAEWILDHLSISRKETV